MNNPPQSPHLLHSGVQDDATVHDKTVNKKYLVNKINYLNFQDQTILISLRHARYDNTISLRVKPLPCAGEHLECCWVDIANIDQILKSYRFEYLLIPDGHKFLLVNAQVICMSASMITLLLPVNCREFKTRKIKRHSCIGITTQFTLNSVLFHGDLIDFTPVSFLMDGNTESLQVVRWTMLESRVNLHMYAGTKILYTGECMITRESRNKSDGSRKFVMSPTTSGIQLIKPKQYRNKRQELVPSPNIVFNHPLIGSTVNLKVADLSGSGFSVEESVETSILLPGMIIPEIEISFAHGLNIRCKAQVVSRNVVEHGGLAEVVKCGFAILDMDIHEHVKLLSILHQAEDKNSYVCTDVDMNALWDFFFETGFIYPEKYAYFQANKEQIKKTYDKLYGQNPHIARHFIYLERGMILGHMAMVRFYEDSWLVHHHAARKTVSMKAGLTVLNQVSQYLNELQNLHFTRLRFIYCYFRPENRFPNRVFGDFARQLNDPKGCSLDKFAYLHYCGVDGDDAMPEPWELTDATPFDFTELKDFYAFVSGGLMIDAFDLQPLSACHDEVAKEYEQLGFKKEKHYYALRREGNLKALIMAHCTDAGFNMANLTNCAIFIALDETIPSDIVGMALGQVSTLYEDKEMPALIYPFSFVEEQSIQYKKVYMLWIMNLHYSDDYFRFSNGLFKGVRTTD
jgi:hypothetical protein